MAVSDRAVATNPASMPLLRWGIVGAGAMAQLMGSEIANTPGNRVTVCASRSSQGAVALAATFAARAEPLDESFFSSVDVDIVYVATPPDSHASIAIAALNAGKHVLVEKPFATTADDASRIAEAARGARRFCMEAMWMRFLPALCEVSELVRGSRLGELRQLTADFSYPLVVDPSHHLFSPLSGGALLDRAVYGVSLAQMIMGPVVDVVSTARLGSTAVDEDTTVLLKHRSGSVSTITSSLRSRGSNEASIRGTTGAVTIHEPYFGARSFAVTPTVPTQVTRGAGTKPGTRDLMVEATKYLAKLPGAPGFLERGRGLGRLGRGALSNSVVPYSGRGYTHQVAAVQSAVSSGLLEHPRMTLADSIEVMRILDRARASWISV